MKKVYDKEIMYLLCEGGCVCEEKVGNGVKPLNTTTFVQLKWKVQISHDFLFLW